ncbi:MAG: hypothetical protein N2Z85_01620, partial [Patescibacteria group bacterium]|nr:hypothetical protein [Patescibacteria group bacterium]
MKIKKLLKIFIFNLFFLFLINKKIYAIQFFKYQNNPLNINLINNYSYILQIDIYEKNNQGCFGIATARRSNENFFSLVKIESTDCLNWNMTREVLNIGQDISNPRLFIDEDNRITLFFTKQDSFDFYRIYKTNCDTNLNCSSNIILVLDPNKNDQKEKNGYFASKVLKYQNQYYLFYGVWGSDGFKIRLAFSNDFENWNKCPNNLLYGGADGPFPIIQDNFIYLFYHKSDSSGIKLAKANLPLNCNLNFQDEGYLLQRDTTYDAKHLIFPSVFFENNNFKIFYSGLNQANSWKLNLACSDINCNFYLPTPTPTLSPTPTLTPTSTPTPTAIPTKIPIVILPGLMGSWNKKAV